MASGKRSGWHTLLTATALTAVAASVLGAVHGEIRKTSGRTPAKTAVAPAKTSATPVKSAKAKAPAPTPVRVAPTSTTLPNGAEGRLLQVIDLIERQELDAALKAVERLTADVPNFRAAQLVYADLLHFKTGRQRGTGAVVPTPPTASALIPVKHDASVKSTATAMAANPTGPAGSLGGPPLDWKEQLQGLREELKRRVHSTQYAPVAGTIPSDFVVLGSSVRHAMAIDASKSRLYLFANEGGKLQLKGDYYVSVARLGMGKSEEGDQRTPRGVYFTARHIPGVKLPEFYGKGALTINYPNDWDRATGRSGGGIWLHGTPPEQFARLPESSDGCLVLANPDLLTLMRTVGSRTPVVIRDRLHWVAQSDTSRTQARDPFLRVFDGWSNTWKRQQDRRALDAFYATDNTIAQIPPEQQQALFGHADAAMRDFSVYAWSDPQGDIRIVDMTVRSHKTARDVPLRQYWRKSGQSWKLFSEEILG